MPTNNQSKSIDISGNVFVTEASSSQEKVLPGQTAFYKRDGTTLARLYIPNLEKLLEQNRNIIPKSLADAISNKNYGYVDFFLTSVTEQQRERVQVFETIGDEYSAYFFGKMPPVFIFSGQLMNVKQDNWRHAFLELYNKLLRGTQLQRFYRYVTVYYDRMYVTGSIISLSTELRAETQMVSAFTFEMLVKKIDMLDKDQDFNPSKIAVESPLQGYGQNVSYTGTTAINIEIASEGAKNK